ncbi:hypothetical protein F511_30365 [Dorcoceras hygrometricum]|uniref:Uncharacterized protein n=1 Tax=Dorcoceras hygrometricum TaxID=472368 RepID=A0A2Z7BZM2_9LAMI|nr:hypothetical protein F511_30365 [Dorcoceras hygrometricum]
MMSQNQLASETQTLTTKQLQLRAVPLKSARFRSDLCQTRRLSTTYTNSPKLIANTLLSLNSSQDTIQLSTQTRCPARNVLDQIARTTYRSHVQRTTLSLQSIQIGETFTQFRISA